MNILKAYGTIYTSFGKPVRKIGIIPSIDALLNNGNELCSIESAVGIIEWENTRYKHTLGDVDIETAMRYAERLATFTDESYVIWEYPKREASLQHKIYLTAEQYDRFIEFMKGESNK